MDKLIEEFMAIVDAMTEERHLQKGIARSQLPCSMVAILDKERLSILAQFRLENRFASYFYKPDIALTPQQAANSAQWEFGFEDAFIIQFPAELLEQSTQERHAALQKVASEHIDSEFLRLEEMLSLMRTRPIFGQAVSAGRRKDAPSAPAPGCRTCEEMRRPYLNASQANNLPIDEAEDIRSGRSAVREMWDSLNHAAVIIADLTGADAGVMYGLGIAHTLGKETILIHPQGSKYLTDIPRTYRIEYEDSDAGRAKLEEQLSQMLGIHAGACCGRLRSMPGKLQPGAYNVIYVLHLYEAPTPNSGLLASLDPGGEKRLKKIRLAIAGLGNCASSLIQGIEYYKHTDEKECIGLMHYDVCGYRAGDIDVVAAFDIDARKVGKDVGQAIFAPPNCTKVFYPDVPRKDVEVKMGPVLDGVAPHMLNYPEDKRFVVADVEPCDVEQRAGGFRRRCAGKLHAGGIGTGHALLCPSGSWMPVLDLSTACRSSLHPTPSGPGSSRKRVCQLSATT